METLKDKLEKEVKIKNLLNIPFDSKEILDSVSPDVIEFSLTGNLHLESYGGVLTYKFVDSKGSTIGTSSSTFSNFCNYIQENYMVGVESDRLEMYVIDLYANDKHFHRRLSGNTLCSDNIIRVFMNNFELFKNLGHVPTSLHLTFKIERCKEQCVRENYFNNLRGGTCEQILDTIFGTKLDESSMSKVSNTHRNSYSSPFNRNSLKGIIYSRDKEHAAFLIEYFWGKKLKMTPSNAELSRFLASAQNKRFGINDVQLAKKLTDIVKHSGYNVLKSQLLELGIKPATDMSRWVKRRGLTL